MLRPGILTLAIPTGCAVVSSIVERIIAGFVKAEKAALMDVYFDNGSGIGLGVMFIVMSLLCRYGAKLMKKIE